MANNAKLAASGGPVTSYHEVKVGKTLYRVTSIYKGEIYLRRALEDLTVSRALQRAPPAGSVSK